MKTTNKIIAVSILAMLAVPAAHAKIVAETMLSEESGHYSSTHTVQSEINAKQDTANMETNTSSFNVDSTTKYPSMAVAQKMIEDQAENLSDDITDLTNNKQDKLNSGTGGNVVSSGNGNVVTAVSAENGVVTVTKGTTLGSLATKSAVASADITDGTIVNADVSNSAAITTDKMGKITGYTKATTNAALSASNDTLNVALGKLEKKADDAQAAADAAASAAASHTHATSDVTTLGGYSKGTSSAALATTDTLNAALGKLENQIDKKVTANSGITAKSGNNLVSYDAKGLVTGSVAAGSLATKSTITSSEITDGTITTSDISSSAGITKGQLASAVQTSLGLADTALQAADITGKQDIQIGAAKSGTTASTDSGKAVVVDDDGKIAMSTNKLGTLAYKSTVVSADITDGTITTSDIKDGTIANADVSSSAAITTDKMGKITGYTKATTNAALSASNDTLNVALGKLEKKADDAQAAADAAASAAASHTHASQDVTAMTGYAKASTAAAIAATDSLNTAIGKLEKTVDGKVTANSAITAKSGNNLVSYDAKGLVTGGVAAGSLATKSAVASSDITDGTIVNADISDSAAIAQSKISGLSTSLAAKQDNLGGTNDGGKLVVTTTTAGTVTYTNAVPTAIPQTPSTDGVFVLTAKNANGTTTFYWEDIGR